MDNIIKHLEMIQNIINRMAHNSFLLKGWSVMLISALFVLMKNQSTGDYLKLTLFLPLLAFWLLDGYFLQQERLYRKLYDKTRKTKETEIDFSMNASIYKNKVDSWLKTCFSITLVIFYSPILILIVVVNIIEVIL
jgi:hypothetical protein